MRATPSHRCSSPRCRLTDEWETASSRAAARTPPLSTAIANARRALRGKERMVAILDHLSRASHQTLGTDLRLLARWRERLNGYVSLTGLILVSVITPGPNNLLVLRMGSAGGVRSTLPAVAGIVAGGLTMLELGQMGIAATVSRYPAIRSAIGACGAIYLVGLGLLMMYRSAEAESSETLRMPAAPQGMWALFTFQFFNPKAWVLVLTVSSISDCMLACNRNTDQVMLAMLFMVIPGTCLLAWAWLGQAAARMLQRSGTRTGFNFLMGLLLVASAAQLLLH
jgi:threonine/homoserine/homoserine lactone efflux protein